VKGWVSAMVDITDRKRVHDAVRQLAAIVESSDDAIISRKLDGEIMSWNKGAEKLFGYTATEALGKPVLMLIPRERINEETTIVGKIRQGSSVEHYETVRVRKDGSRVDVSLSVSPIRNEFGGVIGASKIARDITQQKRYAEELEAAQRQLRSHAQSLEQKVEERTALLREAVAQMEEFSYTVSHDLRAPLRAMNSYSQALLEDYAPQLDGTAREYLNRIQRSCQRMERLTHDVLMYSRLVRSEVVLDPIDLDEMMLDIIDQYEDLQEPRAEVELASPLGQAVGHEVSLGQCLTNLLTNAVKFVGPGVKPKIRVWTEKRGARVRIWIEDNGIGIAPEHQAKIFLIFERLHGREEYEGTGMGLAIVRKTMEKMGGSCGVESKGSDGSRFWLELPLADAAHEDATTTHPAGRG
jgi:PAS domain S-box-containing protein